MLDPLLEREAVASNLDVPVFMVQALSAVMRGGCIGNHFRVRASGPIVRSRRALYSKITSSNLRSPWLRNVERIGL